MSLVNQFREYLQEQKLVEHGDRIILGVSGGPDSLTMLDLFVKIKDEYQLELIVFHLNHMFRKEAQAEADFVSGKAKEYNLPEIIEAFDLPQYIKKEGLSPEEAARRVRFKLLRKWVERARADKVALAHHRDDLVETVFLNLLRGTGLKGLAGIKPISEWEGFTLIHPLLPIKRQQIEEYCQKKTLNPRLDSTNLEIIYTRNKIRHRLLPYLEKEFNPALKEVVSRMAEIVRAEDNFLSSLAGEKLRSVMLEESSRQIILSLAGLQGLATVLRNRVIKAVLARLKGNNIDLYYPSYRAIDQLITRGSTGKFIGLKGNIRIKRSYDRLIIEQGLPAERTTEFLLEMPLAGELVLPVGKKISSEVRPIFHDWLKEAGKQRACICDFELIELPLLVRNRRKGDRFIPYGMKGEKKIKDFFIDQKVPVEERDSIPLVTDGRGKIIWVAGLRMDDRYRVTARTERVLKLAIIDLEGI